MRYAVTILLVCVVALMTLGTVMLCSAPAGFQHHNFEKQLAFCVLGGLACWAAARGDYLVWRRYWRWVYAGTLVLLVAVLVVGVSRGGARRWFSVGHVLFQPSELAKLALIIALASYAEWNQRQMPRLWRGLFAPLGLALPYLGLILVEPDFGTTMLLAAVTFVMLFVAGVRWQPIVGAVLVGGVLLGFFIYHDPVRRERVEAAFGRDAQKSDAWYQSEQSMIAIGSGGPTGVGLGEGRQKLGYVPVNQTDFIFSIVGEELGLAGSLPVVLAYLAVFLCGLYIAWHARDVFGFYLGLGITVLWALQSLVNLGVVTALLPNKGLSLPLVSYGGSSLVTTMAGVGLLLNVARHAAEPEPAFAAGPSLTDVPTAPEA